MAATKKTTAKTVTEAKLPVSAQIGEFEVLAEDKLPVINPMHDNVRKIDADIIAVCIGEMMSQVDTWNEDIQGTSFVEHRNFHAEFLLSGIAQQCERYLKGFPTSNGKRFYGAEQNVAYYEKALFGDKQDQSALANEEFSQRLTEAENNVQAMTSLQAYVASLYEKLTGTDWVPYVADRPKNAPAVSEEDLAKLTAARAKRAAV